MVKCISKDRVISNEAINGEETDNFIIVEENVNKITTISSKAIPYNTTHGYLLMPSSHYTPTRVVSIEYKKNFEN